MKRDHVDAAGGEHLTRAIDQAQVHDSRVGHEQRARKAKLARDRSELRQCAVSDDQPGTRGVVDGRHDSSRAQPGFGWYRLAIT